MAITTKTIAPLITGKRSIEDLIREADEAHAEEQEESRPEFASKNFILYNLPAWKRWYLKKNQPKNYMRVTQIVPPGLEEHPGMWQRKFQIWTKGKLMMDYHIEADTFTHFFNHPEWQQSEDREMKYAILKPVQP